MASLAEEDGESPPPQRNNVWTARLAIFGVLALVLGPVTWRWAPREIGRWYEAAAVEKKLDGDDQGALEQLENAFRWNPESASAHRLRGEWRLKAKAYQAALQDFAKAIELEPSDPRNLINHSVALQHLGRHQEAIEDWEQLRSMLQQYRAPQVQLGVALNGLAYARALGNSDLDQALEEINEALQLAGWNAAMLDTRGYIQYLRGELEPAHQDLDRAVRETEGKLIAAREDKSYADLRDRDVGVSELEQTVAVLRYHRSLVYQQMGESELAAQDLRRVKELGYEPDEHLF
jgi:tetratricopeptide (TPR) repeat protein